MQNTEGRPADYARAAVAALERFLETSRNPAIFEPGEDPLPVTRDNSAIAQRGTRLMLECWDDRRTFSRRILGVVKTFPGRLDLEVERFGGRVYTLTIADLEHPESTHVKQRGLRHKHRQQFHDALRRQFPEWKVEELSTEPDLQRSFSSLYPRAYLRKGSSGLAVMGTAPEALAPEAALSFGLLWLDHLRRRETRVTIQGLVMFAPAGKEADLCHRIRSLDPRRGPYVVFVQEGSHEQRVEPADYTNLNTHLRHVATAGIGANAPPDFVFHGSEHAEAMLEARVRQQIEKIDASLLTSPVYSQVLQFAGSSRGLMDLVAVDRDGRLTVIELKVSQEIQLPLQALDYWIRVKWHLERGDFSAAGYFPGKVLSAQAPRLMLVAPALEFHPSNEIVLDYLAPEVAVERIGLGLEWKHELKVVFRSPGLPAHS